MTGNMDYAPDQSYYDVIKTYFVENNMYSDLNEYRSFIAEAAHVLDQEGRQLTSVYPKTIAQMKYVSDAFSSQKPLESVLHYIATTYVDNFGVENIQELENLYYTYVKSPSLHDSFKAKYDRWDLSTPGKRSPDFSAMDIDGRSWSLADFKGRYVYVDMWATWCAPCRRELPYLKALADKFQDAQISFVGLSIDSDKEKWSQMVKNGEMPGVQLYLGTGSSFQKNYGIDAIPRFILIDRNGRIISNDMSRPSSDETAEFLESLDGIR
jgi:thiol-disulfide isomerase/thioredoxin